MACNITIIFDAGGCEIAPISEKYVKFYDDIDSITYYLDKDDKITGTDGGTLPSGMTYGGCGNTSCFIWDEMTPNLFFEQKLVYIGCGEPFLNIEPVNNLGATICIEFDEITRELVLTVDESEVCSTTIPSDDTGDVPIYDSYNEALLDLGSDKKFRWSAGNLDGVSSPNDSQLGIT